MNYKIFLKEIFHLACWMFFPIGLPILGFIHYLQTRNRKKELSDFINKIESPKDSSLEKLVLAQASYTPSSTEIVDNLLFEISSDVACGRIEQASTTIKMFLSENNHQTNLFIKRFIARQYDLNSSLFEITIFLFDFLNKQTRQLWAEKLINSHPLHFSEDQIDQVLKTEPISNKDPKALLICFLANKYDKVKILLQHGYKPGELNCIPISYNYSIKDSDGTYFHNVSNFTPNPKYLNIRLERALSDLEITSIRKAN